MISFLALTSSLSCSPESVGESEDGSLSSESRSSEFSRSSGLQSGLGGSSMSSESLSTVVHVGSGAGGFSVLVHVGSGPV